MRSDIILSERSCQKCYSVFLQLGISGWGNLYLAYSTSFLAVGTCCMSSKFVVKVNFVLDLIICAVVCTQSRNVVKVIAVTVVLKGCHLCSPRLPFFQCYRNILCFFSGLAIFLIFKKKIKKKKLDLFDLNQIFKNLIDFCSFFFPTTQHH